MIFIISAKYKKFLRVKGYEKLVFYVKANSPKEAYRNLILNEDGDLDNRTIKFIDEISDAELVQQLDIDF